MLDKWGKEIFIGDYVIDLWKDLSRVIEIIPDGDNLRVKVLPILNKSHMVTNVDNSWSLSSAYITKISPDEAIIYSLGGKI